MAIGVFMPLTGGLGGGPDPHFANTTLLMRANTTLAMDDSSYGQNIIPDPGPSVDTSIFRFGGGSIKFNGAGHISVTPNANLSPQAGDFTLEMWWRPEIISGQQIFYSGYGNVGNFIFWMDGGTLKWSRQGIADQLSYNWSPAVGRWYHIAASRQSGTARMFVDGSLVASATGITTNYGIPQWLVALGIYGGTNAGRLRGHIDDLRFTKNVCRYTANFAPPSYELPNQ